MQIDQYAKAAAPIYQERGAYAANHARLALDAGDLYLAALMQRTARQEYKAAREIMEIERNEV